MKTTGILAAAVLGIFAVIIMARGNASSSPREASVAADAVGIFYTSGMTCGSCTKKIETTLKGTGAVAAVEVDVEGGRFTASFDSRKVQPKSMADRVTALGYPTTVAAVMTEEQYRAVSGRDLGGAAPAPAPAKSGCGGGCCDKRPAAAAN